MTIGKKVESRSFFIANFIVNNKALFILIILVISVALASDLFFTPKNLLNVLRQVCTMAVVGIGFTVILASGNIDLSVGSILGLCGVIMGMLSRDLGLPIGVIIALGILSGILLGFINASLITFFNLPAFIITIATLSIFRGISYMLARNAPVIGISNQFVFFGQGYFGPIPVPVYLMIFVMALVWLLLNKTVFGRHVIAMGGNLEAARNAGVNISATRIGAYVVAGACAAVAGLIMTGRTASAQLSAGQGLELDAVAAVVIGGTPLWGGRGNVTGTVFGCIIVGVINNALNLLNVDSNWQIIAKGLLIIIAITLDSQGERISEWLRKQTMVRDSGLKALSVQKAGDLNE